MGRRAHPIFEHFTRGAKLSNNSNRYEQLCKYCGAHFAQGRPTSLQKHLNNCPLVPQDIQRTIPPNSVDRQASFEALNQHGFDEQRLSLDLGASPFLQHDISHEFPGLDALASASLAQPFTYIDTDAPLVDPQLGSSFAFTEESNGRIQQDHSLKTGNGRRVKQMTSWNKIRDNPRTPSAKLHKTRGAFSDSRKQEVHEVRKRGACMRCRSLNKVCGVETPCEQCRRIAHKTTVWPFGCIRIENGKTFTVFDLGIHALKAHHVVSDAIGNTSSYAFGTVDIVHSQFPDQPINVTVSCCKTSPEMSFLFITEEVDVLKGKVSNFLDSIDNDAASVSPIIRETVRGATKLVSDDIYGYGDLKNAIRVWKAALLLSSRSLKWQTTVSIRSDVPSSDWTATPSLHQVLERSHYIIIAQLNEIIESSIDKHIFTKLDRRLGSQKEKNKTEVLFLILILLNAVERYSWYLNFIQHRLDANAVVDSCLWPFEDLPSTYLRQGVRLGALYNIWTHCRHLIPSMTITQEGILKAEGLNNAESLVGELLARSSLSFDALIQMDEAKFDPLNEGSLDGKFWAQLFLEKDVIMLRRMKRDWFET